MACGLTDWRIAFSPGIFTFQVSAEFAFVGLIHFIAGSYNLAIYTLAGDSVYVSSCCFCAAGLFKSGVGELDVVCGFSVFFGRLLYGVILLKEVYTTIGNELVVA